MIMKKINIYFLETMETGYKAQKISPKLWGERGYEVGQYMEWVDG